MKKLLLSVITLASAFAAHAQCNELFFSEYIDGTGNDKALEIYNPTNAAINLSGYSVQRYSNGSTSSTAGGVLNLSGTIAAHDVFVLVNGQTVTSGTSPACSPSLQALADQLGGVYPDPLYMNGDDALTIEKAGVKLDIFGKIGEDPGSSWTDVFPYTDAAGARWTKDHTLQRKSTIQQGVTTNPTAFDVTVEWDSLPKDTWTGLGVHNCNCPVSGVEEIDHSISMVIYPNPSNANYFNISTTENIHQVNVINLVGQTVLSYEGRKQGKIMTVDTNALPSGVYFVKVLIDNNRYKVVKYTRQ